MISACYEELAPCNPKNTMNRIVVYKKIKKVATKEDCNMECVENGDGCQFWDFKVCSLKGLPKKVHKRTVFLNF